MTTFAGSNNIAIISLDIIHTAVRGNQQYKKLISMIQGFPRTHNLTAPEVHEYWDVSHRLSTDNGLMLLDQSIVILKTQQRKVLHCLNSAHLRVVSMKVHADESVYWPGIDASICSIRTNCMVCSNIPSSQPWELIILT